MGYNLLINGVYRGYNPPTNHLLTSWDIQVGEILTSSQVGHLLLVKFGFEEKTKTYHPTILN